ncbi:hypothetical protein B0H10DRAFT_2232837 [Mycena sp. CBHHK59/15]|nr:hypothetical protein B0H10DRAFT_2232837 [Mycena sp. CBHHK59/15]
MFTSSIEADSLDDEPGSNEVRQLFAVLVAHSSHQSLEMIIIEGFGIQPTLNPVDLRTMFCFRNVTYLSLSFEFHLGNTELLDIARAWPIEELALAKHQYPAVAPRVMLQGLYVFAQHCPHLSFLGLALNTTALSQPSLAAVLVSQTALEKIKVFYSPITTMYLISPPFLCRYLLEWKRWPCRATE